MNTDKPKKKAKGKSPTSRSLEYLRKLGYKPWVVEKFVRFPPPGHRVDMYGFIDVVAIGPGRTVAVQATTGGHLANRATKIRACDDYPMVRAAQWVIEVHGWRKLADGRWHLRILDMETGCERSG